MKRIIGASIVLFCCTQVLAQSQGIYVEGSVDCGTWLKARKETRAQYFEHFLVGFLNGLALASGIEFWRAKGVPANREQIYLWMDNYCTQNPLDGVYEGAYKLMNERTDGAVQAV